MKATGLGKQYYRLLLLLIFFSLVILVSLPFLNQAFSSQYTLQPVPKGGKGNASPKGDQADAQPDADRLKKSKLPLLMSGEEVDLFVRTVRGAKVYAEWGSGGSTELAPFLVTSIAYSVEHAVPWCKSMLKKGSIQVATFLERLQFHCLDVGAPVQAFGNLKNKADFYKMKPYIEFIDEIAEDHIDVVLIDGRFRSAVGLYLLTSPKISTETVVLVHDFKQRPNYHVLLSHYDVIESKASLSALRMKPKLSKDKLLKDYEKYAKIQQ